MVTLAQLHASESRGVFDLDQGAYARPHDLKRGVVWKGEKTMTKPPYLSEYDRAMLRTMLAFPGTAPAVFTNENVRRLFGADETCMTCPLCATTAQGRVDGGKLCQELDATNAATCFRRVRERGCH